MSHFEHGCSQLVSTHAPTRGATLLRPLPKKRESFNPRAHEGRDRDSQKSLNIERRFNPRAHEGRDRLLDVVCVAPQRFNPRAHEGRDITKGSAKVITPVSTHAPTRGAT